MSSRTRRVEMDVDGAGVVAAFGFGVLVGLFLAYPALPQGIKSWNPAGGVIRIGPVGGPLLIGTGLFLSFFLGTFLLNWLFLGQDSE